MAPDEPFSSGLGSLLSGRVLIVAAHPDDEVIGLGAQLPQLQGRVDMVHVTHGSPDRPGDAERAGLSSREEYAVARRQELLEAVSLGAVPVDCCHQVGFIDQQAARHMPDLTCKLAGFIHRLRPAAILTHPYEGGHPDHDACAVAVRAAVALRPEPSPQVWEFTSYHAGPNGVETGIFLPGADSTTQYQLTAGQQALKRRMFDCFRTQQHVLSIFRVDAEAFRLAPEYDFTQPPHPGRLHYEQFDWGITAHRWRELAAEAMKQMGLDIHATHCS